MSTNLDFWKNIVGESWYINNKQLFDSDYMKNLINFLLKSYQTSTVFPLQKDIFKAFRLTSFDDVKVVILGQDPYPTTNGDLPDATGLAFANPVESIRINPSLKQIHRAVENSCYNGLKVDFDISLESWAKQGVLLLNTALTVNKYSPSSHTQMWDGFTRFIIESLAKQKENLHFVFWGNNAKQYSYLVNPLFHYVYEGVHPAYAARKNEEWKCTHFTDINSALMGKDGKGDVIVW